MQEFARDLVESLEGKRSGLQWEHGWGQRHSQFCGVFNYWC